MLFNGDNQSDGQQTKYYFNRKIIVIHPARIKTQWASIKLSPESKPIICLESGNSLQCLCFETVEELADAIKNKHISVKQWAFSVPDEYCIVKSASLPANDISQAYKMLEFELPAVLPLPPEELVYGCSAISHNNGLLETQLYIIKTSTLQSFLEYYKTIGIKPSKVMMDSVAVQSWFNPGEIIHEPEIDLVIRNKQVLIFSRSHGNLGKHGEIIFHENGIEYVKEKVVEEILYHATEIAAAENERVVLNIAADADIRAVVRQWFNSSFENIQYLEFPELIHFADNTICRDNYSAYESVVARGLIRAAKNPDLACLNLLPQKILKRINQIRHIKQGLVTALFFTLLVLCLWLNFSVMNWRMERMCRIIKNEITPIEYIAATVERKRQQVKAVQKQFFNRDQISNIFADLYAFCPKEISISQMAFSSKADVAKLSIKGQADTLSHAFEYSDAMKKSKLLNAVQIINAQQIPRPGGNIVEFKAECTIKND
jgi:hypothetical protein